MKFNEIFMRDRPPPERGAFLEIVMGSCSIPGSTKTPPAKFLLRCVSKTQKVCSEFANFAPKICAISAPNAAFCVAKRCSDSSETCVNVRTFAQRTTRKFRRNFRAPRPKNRRNSAPNSSVVDENFLSVRRRSRHFPIMIH